ncbi:MAG: putative sugar O-methyltransferase [Bacteroidales bacterium]|nr:putative sugar O-methyltransferase [Bacteroidales bacterium]
MDFSNRFNKANVKNYSLEEGMKDRTDNSITENKHKEIVKRISKMYKKFFNEKKSISVPYKTSGEWEDYISERKGLYNHLLNENIDEATEILKNFWRNELGTIVKEYAKYDQIKNNETDYIERFKNSVLRNFLIYKEVFKKDSNFLKIPNCGNPWGIVIESDLIAPKSTRFAAHSIQIQNLTKDISCPIIAEIGGGYGGLAYYLLRDNKDLTYIDFDLPETLVLISYYLLYIFPEKKIFLYGEGNIPDKNELNKYSAILLPNYCLPVISNDTADVFYNSFSLSEIHKDSLDEYFKQISRITKKYFFHNNMDRKGVVNRGYERMPCSEYPIDEKIFTNIYTQFDLFHSHKGDYKECLYIKS